MFSVSTVLGKKASPWSSPEEKVPIFLGVAITILDRKRDQ